MIPISQIVLGSVMLLNIMTSSENFGSKNIEVFLEVRLPNETPDEKIFIAGSSESIGNWKADGFELSRIDSLTASCRFKISRNEIFEYKITRGSWQTVEKDKNGAEIQNRKFDPRGFAGKDTIEIKVDVASWSDTAKPASHTLTGDIRFHENFQSHILENSRTISVYLPPGYKNSRRRYRVLYMHDGQNIFDAATSFSGVEWGVDEACEQLISEGKIEPIIVVGINNNDKRVDEYTPAESTDPKREGGGKGVAYGKFIIEELKPFIDRIYRTRSSRKNTFIMGSSLGGLISLHLAWTRPDIFGNAGIVSPALWWADSEILQRIKKEPPPKPLPKLWIDMGTEEGNSHESFKECIEELSTLKSILKEKGWREGRNLKAYLAEGQNHSERAWNSRIEIILEYFFKIPKNN